MSNGLQRDAEPLGFGHLAQTIKCTAHTAGELGVGSAFTSASIHQIDHPQCDLAIQVMKRVTSQMLSQGVSNETKSFIREKMRSAVDLLRNIEHRRQTIYKVVESIVQRQRDFLDHGVQHIKPMMLKDIAEDIGMHLSTVSRVVNRKYAHTPQGVIELRRFFTEGMLNEEGEDRTTGSVDWIVFSSTQTPQAVMDFYTPELMTANGWEATEESTCVSGSQQGIDEVGALCVFQKSLDEKQVQLAIIAMLDKETQKTDLFYLRLEMTPTPVPQATP